MNAWNLRLQWWLIRALGAALLVLLVVPLLSLVLTDAAEGLLAGLASNLVLPALRISILSSCVSVAIVVSFGTPLAWWQLISREEEHPRAIDISTTPRRYLSAV